MSRDLYAFPIPVFPLSMMAEGGERSMREDSSDGTGWYAWREMFVPNDKEGFKGRGSGRRGRVRIDMSFIPDKCGIYEFAVSGNTISKMCRLLV